MSGYVGFVGGVVSVCQRGTFRDESDSTQWSDALPWPGRYRSVIGFAFRGLAVTAPLLAGRLASAIGQARGGARPSGPYSAFAQLGLCELGVRPHGLAACHTAA
jgi:hypothetical protein